MAEKIKKSKFSGSVTPQNALYNILNTFPDMKTKNITSFSSVYYPVAIIEAEFEEDTFEEFEFVQKTVLQLISLGITDAKTLTETLGLSAQYVQNQLKMIEGLGYTSNGHLTPLGALALKKDKKIQRIKQRQKFQVDALGGVILKSADRVEASDLLSAKETNWFSARLDYITGISKEIVIDAITNHSLEYLDHPAEILDTNIRQISVIKCECIKYARCYMITENGNRHPRFFYRHYNKNRKKREAAWTYREFAPSASAKSDEIMRLIHLKTKSLQAIDDDTTWEILQQTYGFRKNGLQMNSANGSPVIMMDSSAFIRYRKSMIDILQSVDTYGEYILAARKLNGNLIRLRTEDNDLKEAASLITEKVKKDGRDRLDDFLTKKIGKEDMAAGSVIPQLVHFLENPDAPSIHDSVRRNETDEHHDDSNDPVTAEVIIPGAIKDNHSASLSESDITNVEDIITVSEKLPPVSPVHSSAEQGFAHKDGNTPMNAEDPYPMSTGNAFSFMQNIDINIYKSLIEASKKSKIDFQSAGSELARGGFEAFINLVLRDNHITEKRLREYISLYRPNYRISGAASLFQKIGLLTDSRFNSEVHLKKRLPAKWQINFIDLNGRNRSNDCYYFLRELGNVCSHPDMANSPGGTPELSYKNIIKGLEAIHRLLINYYNVKSKEYRFDPNRLQISEYVIDSCSTPQDTSRSGCIYEYDAHTEIDDSFGQYAVIRLYDKNKTDSNFIHRNQRVSILASRQSISLPDGMVQLNAEDSEKSTFYILAYIFNAKPYPLEYIWSPKNDNRRMSLDDRIEFCCRILECFENLHNLDEPIYHRMLTYDCVRACYIRGKWVPYVIKFDYAKLNTAVPANTVFKNAAYAREHLENKKIEKYMAPEWGTGDTVANIDWAKVDIYSLGVLFADLLSGKFQNHLLLENEMLAAGIPESLAEIINQMLEEAPRLRPELSDVKAIFEKQLSIV